MKISFKSIVLILFLLRLIVAPILWHPDLRNHMDWGIRFWEYGPRDFYSQNVWSFTWPNQPPGTMLIFAGVRIFYEFLFDILWKINVVIPAFPSIIVTWAESNLYPGLLKLPAILADMGIAYLIYKIIEKVASKEKRVRLAKFGAIIWLINPAIWYNSAVWGQYDSVINFFVLLSFYLLLRKSLLLSTLAFALSVYTKASLLILVPIWFIYAFRQNFKLKSWIYSILCSVLFIVVLTIPFADKNVFIWLYELYKDKIFTQQLHVITANAFNLWAGIAGIHELPDILPFLGLNFKLWSYILYSLFYIPALFIIYKFPNSKTLILTLAYISFATFILLTNMHERYLYPLFPYLTILFALGMTKKTIYWSISVISLLNLYNFWFTPKITFLISFLSFGDRLIPRFLGFLMFTLFIIFAKLIKLNYVKQLKSNFESE